MSDVEKIDLHGPRLRLHREANRDAGPDGDGSLYLRALACCWLAAADTAEEKQLEALYTKQAEFEGVADADALLTDIISGIWP